MQITNALDPTGNDLAFATIPLSPLAITRVVDFRNADATIYFVPAAVAALYACQGDRGELAALDTVEIAHVHTPDGPNYRLFADGVLLPCGPSEYDPIAGAIADGRIVAQIMPADDAPIAM